MNPTTSIRRTKTGFTLVELLVVITIIGLLASLIFPAMNMLVIRARQSVSAGNLKQIHMVMMQYMQENNFFPTKSNRGTKYFSASQGYTETVGSFERLHNWAKGDISSKSFACPGSSVPPISQTSNAACTGWNGQHVSYAYDWAAPGLASAAHRIILSERDGEYWQPVAMSPSFFIQVITMNGTLDKSFINSTWAMNMLSDDGVTPANGAFSNHFIAPQSDRINGHWQDDTLSALRNGVLVDNLKVGFGSATRVFLK